MKTVTATELKTRTGEVLDAARTQPVTVEKNGRAVAVILPHEDYERLIRLENEYWLAQVEKAEKSGYIGTEATASLFRDMLKDNAEA